MPITRLCKAIVRPLVKPALGLGFMAAVGLFTLNQFGVSLDDIRRGELVPTLMSKVIQQSGALNGMPGLEGLDEASLAGMLDQANLGDPGAVQAMLRASGSLRGDGEAPKPAAGDTPRGVVIFSPDGPSVEAGDDAEKPAPIVRVHRREAS